MTPQEMEQMATIVGSHDRRLDQLTLLTERLIDNQTLLQDAVITMNRVELEVREETRQLKAGQEQHQAMLLEILRQRP